MKLFPLILLLLSQVVSGARWTRSKDGDARKSVAAHSSASAYVHDPKAIRLGDLRANSPNTTSQDMQLYSVLVPGHGSIKIYGYPTYADVHVSGSVAAHGSWEGNLVTRYCDLLKNTPAGSANVLDVGANIGAVTLPVAACVAGRGTVIAVEGMPSIANHLKAGVLANAMENVAVYPYILSNSTPEDSMEMALNPTNKGGSTVKGNKPWSDSAGGSSVVSASVTTLDAMLQMNSDLQHLRLAKIDIEGSEGLAMKGGRELFSKHPPCTLVVELNSDWLQRAGTSGTEVVSMLNKYGYDTTGIPPGAAGFETYFLNQHDMPKCLSRLGEKVASSSL